VFFWFMVLSLLMIMISKVPDLGQIFQISIALVSVIRITAYYNEDLSRDLAKMLPFALLFEYSAKLPLLPASPGQLEEFSYDLCFTHIITVAWVKFAIVVFSSALPPIAPGKLNAIPPRSDATCVAFPRTLKSFQFPLSSIAFACATGALKS